MEETDSNVQLKGCLTVGCTKPIGPHFAYLGDEEREKGTNQLTKFNYCDKCLEHYVGPAVSYMVDELRKRPK